MMKWGRRLVELIEDWNYLVRRDGWRTALPVVGEEVVKLPCRHIRFAILARPLSEPLPNLTPRLALEIREFRPADIDLVRPINRPSEIRTCALRSARGHLGLLALTQGQPVGYAWSCSETTLERVHLKLEPGDALCTDAYTAPAFRGRGVQTALKVALFRLLRDLGYSRAVAYIDQHNYPSLAVWRRLDGQVVGHFNFIRIGLWRWVRYE